MRQWIKQQAGDRPITAATEVLLRGFIIQFFVIVVLTIIIVSKTLLQTALHPFLFWATSFYPFSERATVLPLLSAPRPAYRRGAAFVFYPTNCAHWDAPTNSDLQLLGKSQDCSLQNYVFKFRILPWAAHFVKPILCHWDTLANNELRLSSWIHQDLNFRQNPSFVFSTIKALFRIFVRNVFCKIVQIS